MAEAARLAQIHAECFTTPRPWSEAEIASLLSQPHVFVLTEGACHMDQTPDGFLIGSAIAGEAELLTLAVRPRARRSGAGSRLVSVFLETARARGASDIFLEVAAGNRPAIALYEKAGFRQAGLRRGYYHAPDGTSEDALILVRPAADAAVTG